MPSILVSNVVKCHLRVYPGDLEDDGGRERRVHGISNHLGAWVPDPLFDLASISLI